MTRRWRRKTTTTMMKPGSSGRWGPVSLFALTGNSPSVPCRTAICISNACFRLGMPCTSPALQIAPSTAIGRRPSVVNFEDLAAGAEGGPKSHQADSDGVIMLDRLKVICARRGGPRDDLTGMATSGQSLRCPPERIAPRTSGWSWHTQAEKLGLGPVLHRREQARGERWEPPATVRSVKAP